MYIDGVVAFGLVIVVLTCIIVGYIGVYAYKHIQQDAANAERKQSLK